jgi:Arc/MetJ-type ribon-helix-helix transcriptional regulator
MTTIRLDEADRHAIATIRQRYGVASDSDAIRLALRLVAASKRVDLRLATREIPETLDTAATDHHG